MTKQTTRAAPRRTAPKQHTHLSLIEDTGAAVTGQASADSSAALRYALQFAARGIPVFPCNDFKEPILSGHWKDNATIDGDTITAWARRTACSAFAMPTGQLSGLVVIDIDPRHGGTREGHGLTPTYTVRTPSGGWHFHYRCDHEVRPMPKYAPGVEVKGDGNYVILPGGRCHGKDEKGDLTPVGSYRRAGRGSGPAVLPAHLAVPRPATPPEPRSDAQGTYHKNDRHPAMVSRARALRSKGLSGGEIAVLLLDFNARRCDPPKPADEVRKIAEWAGALPVEGDDEADIDKQQRKLYVNEEAKRRHASKLAVSQFELPAVGRTLADDLKDPAPPIRYVVDRLHPADTNSLFIAAYTTGKTTSVINLAKALADGVPFLDRYSVDFPTGNIGYLNYEMPRSLMDRWLDDADIENKDRIVKADLRGQRMPLNAPGVGDRLVEWLQGNDVRFLIIDVLAKAAVGFVTDENDNTQARDFTDALDEVKGRAGVSEMVVTTHMGRYKAPDGSVASRGATRYQDWADASWFLSKDAVGTRTMWADGRGVEILQDDAVVLGYDERTRRVFVTGQTKQEAVASDAAFAAVDKLIELGDGTTSSDLRNALTNVAHRTQWVAATQKLGWIERRQEGNAKRCYVTDAGKGLKVKLEGDGEA